jgi:hypothetical protein
MQQSMGQGVKMPQQVFLQLLQQNIIKKTISAKKGFTNKKKFAGPVWRLHKSSGV